ncbi:hypothetical protein L6R52_18915 [Myxococcota bacterium]|nr:hypothetical protein [Myxococcota bacterium]
MRQTPLQTIKKNFESRAKLIETLAGQVDKQNGDTTDAQVKARLGGLTNKKLLRLYKVEQKVREQFGDRAKMIQHIVDMRTKAGLTADAAFRAKLETFTKARLLDLTKQTLADKPAKLTADQKAKLRRGRKAKERAKSAAAKKA